MYVPTKEDGLKTLLFIATAPVVLLPFIKPVMVLLRYLRDRGFVENVKVKKERQESAVNYARHVTELLKRQIIWAGPMSCVHFIFPKCVLGMSPQWNLSYCNLYLQKDTINVSIYYI